MTIALSTIEDAIHAWVVSGSGLDAANVIWELGAGSRPDTTPYISMRAEITPIGFDAQYSEDHASPTPGAEITHRALGMRELSIFMQCFGGDATSAGAPHAILDAVHSAMFLSVRRQALRAAGIGLARWSRVTTLGEPRGGAIFEPRAVFDVAGFVASEATEDGTYIQIVSGENQIVSPAEAFSWDSGA